MKKTFLLIPIIFLASCSNPFESGLEEEPKLSEVNTIIDVAKENQVVTIYKENNGTGANDLTNAVDKAYDSVVVIEASYTSGKQQGTSSGSGVIIAEGKGEDDTTLTYIATCHHVIEGATSFSVTTSSGKEYQAALIGGDDLTDIAVLAIQESGLKIASFTEDSETIKIGSTAIAIGNPLGILANSVTTGIVSSTKRAIKTEDGTTQELIQTDAAINSGNSGGGLFNIYGELIGIVNAKYAATGVEGLGFAIPSNTVIDITKELIEHHYVEGRYKLGLTIADGRYQSGGFFGQVYSVVYISNVESGSSSDGALKTEDILNSITITYADSTKDSISLEKITSASQVTEFIENANLSIGDKITFSVYRNGYNNSAITTIEITLKQYIYSIS